MSLIKDEEISNLDGVVKDYIKRCDSLGIITLENKPRILDRLSKIKIEYVEDKPYGGRTYIDEKNSIIVEICEGTLKKEAEGSNRNIDEYIDENIYHELGHALSLTDGEIFEILKNMLKDENICFPLNYGYSIIDEYLTQSLAQKLIEIKYSKNFEKKDKTFIYDEHGQSNVKIQYDYKSSLDFYGEIEVFAKNIISFIYGNVDFKDILTKYFSGSIVDDIQTKLNGDVEKLYSLFKSMGSIVACDYYQQGYYDGWDMSSFKSILSMQNFKQSIEEFHRIIKYENGLYQSFQFNLIY